MGGSGIGNYIVILVTKYEELLITCISSNMSYAMSLAKKWQGADGRSEENRESMNWKLLWMEDQAYWKKRFGAVSRTEVRQMNNVSPSGSVVFLCHVLRCSGEGSTNMSDGFIQNGILSGRCITKERGQGLIVILGCEIQAR